MSAATAGHYAMGGGKSRCLCELALDLLLLYPAIDIFLARQSHVDIVGSTKKTFVQQVLQPELVARSKESQGEDWIQLHNKSTVHFLGLDDPGKKFSTEYGFGIFDEAHEIAENTVILLNSRLRQRCPLCIKGNLVDCGHFPHGMALAFNPEGPTHWLYRWFIQNATPFWLGGEGNPNRPDGYSKTELWTKDAIRPIGNAEFVVARATENTYLPKHYVEENLGGMPALLRRRYLDGEWLYVSGQGFFDQDALTEYGHRLLRPKWLCRSAGELAGGKKGDRIRFDRVKDGDDAPWWVWKAPVRARWDEETGREVPAHRYVVTVDVSSGTSNDYSAIQVIDVEAFEQVAEFQGKLDTDQLADEAFRAAVVYNGALIAPEITGGWGGAVVTRLERLLHHYKGALEHKPRIFLRRVEDRLKKVFTDRTGWDTTTRSRGEMLTTLEQVLRELEFGLYSFRTHGELVSFAWPEQKKDKDGPYSGVPSARAGANDDLVMPLAIGVHLVSQMPKQLRRVKPRRHRPSFDSTGY